MYVQGDLGLYPTVHPQYAFPHPLLQLSLFQEHECALQSWTENES